MYVLWPTTSKSCQVGKLPGNGLQAGYAIMHRDLATLDIKDWFWSRKKLNWGQFSQMWSCNEVITKFMQQTDKDKQEVVANAIKLEDMSYREPMGSRSSWETSFSTNIKRFNWQRHLLYFYFLFYHKGYVNCQRFEKSLVPRAISQEW